MERKHFLSKSILYIFLALCFLGTGIFALKQTGTNLAYASTVADEGADRQNIVPDYFRAQDLINVTVEDQIVAQETTDNLMDYNTFLSFSSTETNYLKLSFEGGLPSGTRDDLYDYCYYPDPNNTTYFNFFDIDSINFFINGEEQKDIHGHNFDSEFNFITGGNQQFENCNVSPEGFVMYFERNWKTDPSAAEKSNTIKITDENGKVIEGVYTVEINLVKYTCTAGQDNKQEDAESFKAVQEVTEKVVYNFYVLDQENYLNNNQPIVTNQNFDHTVSFPDASSENAYYLYSNYYSKNGTTERKNSLPYIEYDYTRYEVNVAKALSDIESSMKFEYDKDQKTVVATGDEIVRYSIKLNEEKKTARLYFTDVGNYIVSLQAIFVNDEKNQKYILDGFTAPTHHKSKNILVYIYGYQANYTDFDAQRVNGKYPLKELKSYDMENGKFYNSADITSEFLNSSSDLTQNDTQTFTPTKVLEFVKGLQNPIKTDNTPITFTQNATLNGTNGRAASSLVFSTRKFSPNDEPVDTLNGKSLYRANFTGLTDISSEAGTYIYILGYSFQDYWETTNDRRPNQIFYQIFYFEIVASQARISVTTKDSNENIGSGLFYNQDIKIVDNTQNDDYAYRRKVMIRIYAQEFETYNYLPDFNGENGIDLESYKSLAAASAEEKENSVLLQENAHYTIRLFYKSDVASRTDFPINLAGAFDEYRFTIDKEGIEEYEDITARNVTTLAGGSQYQIGEALSGFSTNQSIILSWKNKKSGAETYAFTRYFPLISEQFYDKSPSSAITAFLSSDSKSIPINKMVDLSTEGRTWLDYEGNTHDYKNGSTISGSYVLTGNGLYLVEVFDEAGNRAVRIFFIDNTAPLFALKTVSTGQYELVEESKFLQNKSELSWGENKAIYLANLNTKFDQNVESATLSDDLFKNSSGNQSADIYSAFYALEHGEKSNLTAINVGVTPKEGEVSHLLKDKTYSGWYLTIPINEVNWYLNGSEWAELKGKSSFEIDVQEEANYTFLLRDASNTRFVPASKGETDVVHYQNYYSARQEVVISFDKSKFGISFEGYGSFLNSDATYETGTKQENGKEYKYKTSYLAPVSLQESFYVSIIPTVVESNTKTQVESVKMQYFPYIEKPTEDAHTYTYVDDGFKDKEVTYHYYTLSETATIQETLYEYGKDDAPKENEAKKMPINVVNNATQPGKYIITRKYSTDNGFVYNETKDYFERSLVLYVDPNPVVSDQTTVTDDDGSHVEGLVGGEIFVGMYDNGKDASLVVTFPDSPNGNKNGQTLYNSDSTVNNVLTTNKFPVKLYVPVSKYTKYAHLIKGSGSEGSYEIEVEDNEDVQNYTTIEEQAQELEKTSLLISEYALFVEVYENYNGTPPTQSQLIATSEMDSDKLFVKKEVQGRKYIVGINENAITNGFLKLYKPNTQDEVFELKNDGTYFIRVSQGRFSTSSGATQFSGGALEFLMTIEKSNPDFDARLEGSAISLKSDTVLDSKGKAIQNYYTNQSSVNLVWDRGSEYMAEIDIDAIEFEAHTGNKTEKFYGGGKDKDGQDRKTPWLKEPEVSNTSYIGQISLSNMGIYTNGGYVDITMQFKNHDDDYYQVCKKRITVDLSAPHTNIDNLVQTSTEGGYIPNFSENSLRTKLTVNNGTARSNDETSYNISKNTDAFAYYSYTVSKDYLKTLQNTTDAYEIYVRDFMNGERDEKYDPNNDTKETTYSDFLSSRSSFKTIDKQDSFVGGRYYEIVETDRADNLTIYTIYVLDYSERGEDNEEENKLITYNAPIKSGNQDQQIVEKAYTIADYNNAKTHNMNHNIYSRPGFELKGINFFGEAWTQIKVQLRNTLGIVYNTTYYMTTPNTTANGKILKFDPSGTSQEVDISSLFSEISNTSSLYKSCLTIYNRQFGLEGQREEAFYFNFQTIELSYNWPTLESQDSEFVGFEAFSETVLNSTEFARSFVTEINIYRDNTSTGTPLLGENGLVNKLGLASIWQEINNSNYVTTTVNGTALRFVLNPNFQQNTRLIYEFTDNYGTKYSEVRLYRETIITSEVGCASGNLYAYYDSTLGRTYYVAENGFAFTYNENIYVPQVYYLTTSDGTPCAKDLDADDNLEEPEKGGYLLKNKTGDTAIKTITYNVNEARLQAEQNTDEARYYLAFELQLWDTTGAYRRSVYFVLYNKLPKINKNAGFTLASGEFKLLDANGNNRTEEVVSGKLENAMLSQLQLLYSQPSVNDEHTLVPVRYSISTDGMNYTQLSSPSTTLKCPDEVGIQTYYLKIWYDETYLQNAYGGPRYVFGAVPNNVIYRFNLTAQTTTYWVEMETSSGVVIVKRSNTDYHSPAKENTPSITYTNHYKVNMRYVDGQTAVRVKSNEENNVRAEIEKVFSDSDTVTSVLYHITNKKEDGTLPDNVAAIDTYIVITFIPPSSNFIQEFYADDQTGALNTSKNLTGYTSENVIVSADNPQTSEITLRWTRYNGISSNLNNIRILKDDVQFTPDVTLVRELTSETNTEKEFSEITLKRSGRYTIYFTDDAGNIQRFGSGNGQTDMFTLIFLKDVPFTLTYTDITAEREVTVDPINKASYNGVVTLRIDPATSSYYTESGPQITVERNGRAYTVAQTNNSYVFSQSGNYRVKFSATTRLGNTPNVALREEWYEFTIINEDQYRYSYIMNEYEKYYVEKILRNGIDMTETFVQTLNLPKIRVGEKYYLSKLILSYLDEKTGAGVYTITVNSNNRALSNASWTYKVTIQTGQAPIRISVAQGETTTGNVTITYNVRNMWNAMGECTVRVISYDRSASGEVVYSHHITSENNSGDGNYVLSAEGTFFIQVVTGENNDPLFSWKVTKKAPMNAATIIAIVLSAIALVVIIFLIFKLRKRISVK